MAEPVLLSSVNAWLGGYAIEGSLNNVMLKLSNAELDDGRLGTPAGPGDVLDAKYPGLVQVEATVKGFYSSSAPGAGAEPDPIIFPRISGDPSSWPLTICPPSAPAATPGADGNIAYTVEAAQFSYVIGEKHGALLPYECSSRPRSGSRVCRQTIMLPKLLRTVTATGTARQLGLVGATQQVISTVHLFAITGGSLTVTIQSDDAGGFPSATTRITHTAMTTAANREVKKLAGPIATDDFWRAVCTYTPGTNYTLAVLLSISPL